MNKSIYLLLILALLGFSACRSSHSDSTPGPESPPEPEAIITNAPEGAACSEDKNCAENLVCQNEICSKKEEDEDEAPVEEPKAEVNPDFPNVDKSFIHQWSFEENNGCTVTDGVLGPNCRAGNVPTWTDSGAIGRGLDFDGVDDNVSFSHSPTYSETPTSFTISTWIKVADFMAQNGNLLSQFRIIASAGMSENSGWILFVQKHGSSYLLSVQFRTTTWKFLQAVVQSSTLYHIAVTYDAEKDEPMLYVNGFQYVARENQGIMPAVGNYFNIGGGRNVFASAYFGGLIDEFTIIDEVLTEDEIEYYLSRYVKKYSVPELLRYNFDEAEGEAVNPTSGEIVGRFIGGSWIESPFSGSAVELDGIDDNIEFPISPTYNKGVAQNFSMSLRIKVADYQPNPAAILTQFRIVASGGVTDDAGWVMYTYKSGSYLKLSFELKDNAEWRNVGAYISPNVFYHVAITYDAAEKIAKFYLNGTEYVSKSASGLMPSLGNFFNVGGKRNTADNSFFGGVIDDVRIFKSILTKDDVTAIYQE